MKFEPYTKKVVNHPLAVCAVYQPNPFGSTLINAALKSDGYYHVIEPNDSNKQGLCWVWYDVIGNPIGISDDEPEGCTVDSFSASVFGDNEKTANSFNCSFVSKK